MKPMLKVHASKMSKALLSLPLKSERGEFHKENKGDI
jgi:hypothetical protein